MSKAFTKEDVEPPERSGRHRAATGLPPGAVNYITAEGAARLSPEERHEAVIVPARTEAPAAALFGTTVVLAQPDGTKLRYRIVGAPEAGLEPHWVSWVSPLGRQLLGLKVGDALRKGDSLSAPAATVVALEP